MELYMQGHLVLVNAAIHMHEQLTNQISLTNRPIHAKSPTVCMHVTGLKCIE